MTLADMTLAKAYDKQAVYQLFSVATQIPLTWQTPQVLRNVKIFLDYAEWRDDVCGKRLRNIRAHLSPLGKIDWNGVSYLVEWNDGEVRSIVHCQSDKQAVLPEGHGLNVNFDWNFFWHDLQAEAVLPPTKPAKLFSCFKEPKNPVSFGYPSWRTPEATTR